MTAISSNDRLVLSGADGSKVLGEKASDAGVGDRRDGRVFGCDPAAGNSDATHDAFFEEAAGQTSMLVKPLGPRIIVEKIKETGVSEGGIVIPEPRQRDPRKREITLSRGRVVSVGDLEGKGCKPYPGAIVIYADQTAIQLKIGGIIYGDVLYEDDVIAIIGNSVSEPTNMIRQSGD